jgi:hypothetical protein
MKRISFNPRFVNAAGDDLVSGKIHTIRHNYHFWKRFEGRVVALFTWEGKPYRSKQKVFCVKRLVYVEPACFERAKGFWIANLEKGGDHAPLEQIARNDGFDDEQDFLKWFENCHAQLMSILHFTDFRY